MALEVALDLRAAFHGSLSFTIADLVLSWPDKTKKTVREKFASAVKAAADAGAVFTLLPDRLSGFSTTVEVEDELVLLMRDLLFQSGNRTHNKLFVLFQKSWTERNLNPQT